MRLRVYKNPFAEQPGRIRLLFESEQRVLSRGRNCEFYIYVWIDTNFDVRGFQVVFDEEYVLTYKPQRGISLECIEDIPIKRAVKTCNDEEIEKEVCRLLNEMESEEFSHLLYDIQRMCAQRGPMNETLTLCADECDLLRTIYTDTFSFHRGS